MYKFNIRLISLLLFGYILIPAIVLADHDNYGAAFLKTGAGARMAGIAGAGATLSDDISSVCWNPAGLAMVEKSALLLGSDDLPGDTCQQYLSYGWPWKGRTLCIGMMLRNIDGGEKRGGRNDAPDGNVEASDLLASFGYARHTSSMSSAGIVGKFVQERLSSYDDHAFAVDVGWLYDAQPLRFALGLQNMGGKLKFIRQETSLPLLLRAGIGYCPSSKKMMIGFDTDMFLYENRAKLKIGMERWLLDNLALRAGYQYDMENTPEDRYSFGIGFKQHDWQIDYAYAPYHELGDAHHISVIYSK